VTEELTGTLEVRPTAVGSKSEMMSVVLVVDDADATVVPLRRREATALDAEPKLAAYAGQRVRITGTQQWTTFVVHTIERLD